MFGHAFRPLLTPSRPALWPGLAPLLALCLVVLTAGCQQPQEVAADESSLAEPVQRRVDTAAERNGELLVAAALAQIGADPYLDVRNYQLRVSGTELQVQALGGSPMELQRAVALVELVPGVTAARQAEDSRFADAASADPGEAALNQAAPELRDLAQTFELATRFGTPPEEPHTMEDDEGERPNIALAASGDRPRTYVVQPGDSLSLIANRTMGDGLAWPRIYELNRSLIGPNPAALQAGMELRIPQD